MYNLNIYNRFLFYNLYLKLFSIMCQTTSENQIVVNSGQIYSSAFNDNDDIMNIIYINNQPFVIDMINKYK